MNTLDHQAGASAEVPDAAVFGRSCSDGCNGCDDCTDYDTDEPECSRCHGDGMDPQCDWLMPCPQCQGEQRP